SVTSVEETGQASLYVRALDSGEPIRAATVKLEGEEKKTGNPVVETYTTDGTGKVTVGQHAGWSEITRGSAARGDDVLVIDPQERLPQFANNHWSSSGAWLNWLTAEKLPQPVNDADLAFIFTERPIYKPGESVYVKAYVREKRGGQLRVPANPKRY